MASLERIWALVKTLLFAATFIAFSVIYLPWTLAIRGVTVSYQGPGMWRWVGVLPLAAGVVVMFRCLFAFAWTGLGTPAPFDPPRKLVVSGFYRYLRNPMYAGATLAIAGEVALFGELLAGFEYLLIFAVCVVLFVLLYEEPALRSKFGAEYEAYCRNVPRFFPRLTPWQPPS